MLKRGICFMETSLLNSVKLKNCNSINRQNECALFLLIYLNGSLYLSHVSSSNWCLFLNVFKERALSVSNRWKYLYKMSFSNSSLWLASLDFTSATVIRNPQRKMSSNDTMRMKMNLQGIMFLISQSVCSGTTASYYVAHCTFH